MNRDPGLQRERTTLAWSRTGLALLCVCALTVHATRDPAGTDKVVTLLVAVSAWGVLACAARRRRAVDRRSQAATAPPVVLVQAIAVMTTVAGLGALVLLLLLLL